MLNLRSSYEAKKREKAGENIGFKNASDYFSFRNVEFFPHEFYFYVKEKYFYNKHIYKSC